MLDSETDDEIYLIGVAYINLIIQISCVDTMLYLHLYSVEVYIVYATSVT